MRSRVPAQPPGSQSLNVFTRAERGIPKILTMHHSPPIRRVAAARPKSSDRVHLEFDVVHFNKSTG